MVTGVVIGLIVLGAVLFLALRSEGAEPGSSGGGGILYALPPSPPGIQWHSTIPREFEMWVSQAARETGVAAAKIRAIAYIESRGRPDAVNPADPSYGIMQLVVPTARFYARPGEPEVTGAELTANPRLNLFLGARFLGDLQKKYSARFSFGEWAQAYNVGEPKFDRGIRNPGYGANVSGVFHSAERLAELLR